MAFPWNPPNAFSSVKEYLDYYRDIILEFCVPEYVDELFSCFPTEGQFYLTHGDLLPHNILVDGSKISYHRLGDCWLLPRVLGVLPNDKQLISDIVEFGGGHAIGTPGHSSIKKHQTPSFQCQGSVTTLVKGA